MVPGMPYDFQIVVDSADPHAMADWWAETLDWRVEPQDAAFIRQMVDQGFATEAETTTHNGALVWRTGAAINHPDPLPSGAKRRVLFQTVPEPKTVKDRLHLDVWVGEADRDAVRDKLLARGATFLWEGSQGPHSWYTMADIEGNEFCIT
jgi:glyoxalase superfamily protein